MAKIKKLYIGDAQVLPSVGGFQPEKVESVYGTNLIWPEPGYEYHIKVSSVLQLNVVNHFDFETRIYVTFTSSDYGTIDIHNIGGTKYIKQIIPANPKLEKDKKYLISIQNGILAVVEYSEVQ